MLTNPFALGGATVEPARNAITRGEAVQTLEPRIMDVLCTLAAEGGAVVTREALIERVWKVEYGADESLTRAVSLLRKAFREVGLEGETIETIPKRGYRLALEVGEAPPAERSRAQPPHLSAQSDRPQLQPIPSGLTVSGPDVSADAAKPGFLRQRGLLVGLAVVGVCLIAAAVLFVNRPASKADVDSIVASLTRDKQGPANTRDIAQAGAAVQALRTSGRAAERSSFASLASGDTGRALDVLEDLAADLERKGERADAADVYTRIGAIALVFDQGRGLVARRKAVLLLPTSMRAFQGLLLDTALLRGSTEAMKLVEDTLARPELSSAMRGWVLVHRGLIESELLSDETKATATRNEIDSLFTRTNDPVVAYCSVWLGTIIAVNRDDLASVRELSTQAKAMWPKLSSQFSNMTEVGDVRVQLSGGDWTGAVTGGIAVLEDRGRKGDFLPTTVIQSVCTAGVYSGRIAEVEPYCGSLAQRTESSGGVSTRAFGGLIAAAVGDARGAKMNLEAAEALASPSAPLQPDLHLFEAYAANKRGDIAEAERLAQLAVAQAAAPGGISTSRSFNANALRLLGEWLIAANRGHDACAPLAESERLYAEIAGDAGRAAVSSLRSAANCQRRG
jgi:DNA-binding winged helix-turn-helix (wHTH) protein